VSKLTEDESISVPVDPNEIDPIRGTGIPQPASVAVEEKKHIDGRVPHENPDIEWLHTVYQGDKVPQLTLRAVLMGGVLGALMSVSNLYTSIKLGWAFGVAITACVLSFVIWNSIRVVFPKLSPMSILENNCMQSTASAAGYSTGATIGITGKHVEWPILLAWTIVTAALGVFLAVPMKRQMINQEKLTFPSGVAAAETLRSLYGQNKEAIYQARALVTTLFVGMVVGFLGKGEWAWQKAMGLKIPELIQFKAHVKGVSVTSMPGFGFEPSVLLVGASMLLGSLILYLIVGPEIINMSSASPILPEKILKWSLWTGTAMMVSSGLTAFALQWKTIVRSFTSVKISKNAANNNAAASEDDGARLASIEVPMKWLVVGLIPLIIMMVFLEYIAFKINPALGLVAVVMSFFLALVACRATGETDITPIGAMGKLTQLTYALLAPSNITTNLMAGSVTANIASSSADLLTDLKSGYLLGANARQQFIAQFIGLFFGSLAIVPAWYLMVPSKEVLDKFNPPSANMWKAVAEALSKGIDTLPETARMGILIGAGLGVTLAVIDAFAPKKIKPYLPSAMGLGLSWVVVFANSFAFFVGALIALIWEKINKKNAELYVIPVASGAVAGESLMCAAMQMLVVAMSMSGH
jgi:OPT family oligopeptide transporter